MTGGGAEGDVMTVDGLDGRSLEAAVDAVVEAGRAADRESAEATLETVTVDDTVSWAGARAAIEGVELPPGDPLQSGLEDVKELAASEADRPVVGSRLRRYETRVAELGEERAELADRQRALLERIEAGGDLLGVARRIRDLAESIETNREAIETTRGELAAFEDWFADPRVRFEELTADAEALDAALDELEETVDALAEARGQGREDSAEYAAAWFDTAIRHRAMAVMLADLRWELSALRDWTPHPTASGIGTRLEELAARREALGQGLNDVGDLQLVRRFSGHLSAVDEALEALSPPVEWTAVEETLAAHRAEALDADG